MSSDRLASGGLGLESRHSHTQTEAERRELRAASGELGEPSEPLGPQETGADPAGTLESILWNFLARLGPCERLAGARRESPEESQRRRLPPKD